MLNNWVFGDHEISWLNQFEDDRDRAAKLLNSVRKVSADEFRNNILRLIEERVEVSSQPVGLYAERKIRRWKEQPVRLFKESKTKVKRAYGMGPNPVQPENYKYPETGSEGIVANIITQFVRGNRQLAFDHPGPDLIREKKIRRFILITDFVGSGQQSYDYLQSVWRLSSVKSWKSGKFMDFEVIAFAAAKTGIEKLEQHPSKPTITIVEACRTVFDFKNYDDDVLLELCEKYGPTNSESPKVPRLGFSDIGALIAFSHGMPNNAPRLFHKKGRKWIPLFKGRATNHNFLAIENRDARAKDRLQKMQEVRLAELAAEHDAQSEVIMFSLVLSALKKKPRSALVVSARTGLSMAESQSTLLKCKQAGWINEKNALTAKAYQELSYLRRSRRTLKVLPKDNKPYYIPKQLRALK